MIRSDHYDSFTLGENVLEDCSNSQWRAPDGKIGSEAEIIIDLKCLVRLEAFSIMNGYETIGTKKFTLFGSRKRDGPWTEIFSTELPQGKEMTDEVSKFQASNYK